jgi:hypothetical protein
MARYNGTESSAPPRKLGKSGNDLWNRINMDFVLQDETERETLCQIAEAADQIQDLIGAINQEGAIIENDKGVRRAHAAYTVVRQYRTFIVRSLERLKAHHRPTKILGRPARSAMGIDPEEWEQRS